jgi:hypothetical protein
MAAIILSCARSIPFYSSRRAHSGHGGGEGMKAVVLERIGSPGNLVVRDIPTPEVTPQHVLVGVRACGVGYRDIVDRRGGMPT